MYYGLTETNFLEILKHLKRDPKVVADQLGHALDVNGIEDSQREAVSVSINPTR
jgi:hypothetical protein